MAAWVAKNKLQTKAFSHQVLCHEEENTAVNVISPSFYGQYTGGAFLGVWESSQNDRA